MHEVTAHEAARKFGDLIERAKDEPVAITRYGRTTAVLIAGAPLRLINELLKHETRREVLNAVSAVEIAEDEDKAIRALNKLLRPFRRR